MRLKRYAGTERGYEPITKLARARIEERMDDSSLTWPWDVEVQRHLDNSKTLHRRHARAAAEERAQRLAEGFRRARARAEGTRRVGAHHGAAACAQDEPAAAGNLCGQPEGYGVEADPRELMQRAMFAYMQTRDELDALARIDRRAEGLQVRELSRRASAS